MPDGTMVVVEQAAERTGETVTAIVTNALQTSAGRMVFARVADDSQLVEHMAEAATGQPRVTAKPDRHQDSPSRRNPRR